jgi:hypothetical protein
VRGYLVVSSDERTVGRVADVRPGYLIVESGRLRRTRRPVPREFVHAVDEAAKVFVTVPRRVLRDAPQVDAGGEFDLDAAARHYGLAVSFGRDYDGDAAAQRTAGAGPDAQAAPPPALVGERATPEQLREA